MPVDMKNVIADTFAEMVKQGNVDKITVKALIEECHISRQTFYYHFQDIMDVLEWFVRRATQSLAERSLEAADLRSALKIFISFSIESFPMLQKLMESQRRSQIERIMIEAVERYLSGLVLHRQPDLPIHYGDSEVLFRFNACGLVGVLLYYGGKPGLDQDRLAVQLEQILEGELSGWHGYSAAHNSELHSFS